MPCPNLNDLKIDDKLISKLLKLKPENFEKERKTKTHYLLNKWLLDSIGLTEVSVSEIDDVLIYLLNDRYYRAKMSKKNNAKEEEQNEQDN